MQAEEYAAEELRDLVDDLRRALRNAHRNPNSHLRLAYALGRAEALAEGNDTGSDGLVNNAGFRHHTDLDRAKARYQAAKQQAHELLNFR